MKITGSNSFFSKYMLVLICILMTLPPALSAADTNNGSAPGRKMAQQFIKEMHLWNTTDHSKHKELQKDFKSS